MFNLKKKKKSMKNNLKNLMKFSFVTLLMLMMSFTAYSQGVTTASISGQVGSNEGESLPGAVITAVHTPSGTKYNAVSNMEGRYFIPNMRIGGPYVVSTSFIGYSVSKVDGVFLSLGVTSNLDFSLKTEESVLGEVLVVGEKNPVFSSERTGASTGITNQNLNRLPTISRNINDFTRLTPQASGNS
jgi:hypothetical protein